VRTEYLPPAPPVAHEPHCQCHLPTNHYSIGGWHIRPEPNAHPTAYQRCPHYWAKVLESDARRKITQSEERSKRGKGGLYA